jgi:hypothetical protein
MDLLNSECLLNSEWTENDGDGEWFCHRSGLCVVRELRKPSQEWKDRTINNSIMEAAGQQAEKAGFKDLSPDQKIEALAKKLGLQ